MHASVVTKRDSSKQLVYKRKSVLRKQYFQLTDNKQKMFTDDDIDLLIQQIQSERKTIPIKDENDKDLEGILFERNNLILKILNLCKNKFSKTNDEYLVKAVNWIIIEIRDSLIFKTDDRIFEIIEKHKKNDDFEIIKWLEEFSGLKDRVKEQLEIVENNMNLTENEQAKMLVENIEMPLGKILSCGSSFEVGSEHLDKIQEPDFNIFILEKEVGQESILATVSSYIFITLGLYSQVHFNNFEKALVEIAKGYIRRNPYHNDLHAADVNQTLFMYLKYGKIVDKLRLNNLDVASLLTAAIIHDFKHPGYTNQFMINTESDIAIEFNGKLIE